jgi:hypothetical protein
VSPPLRSASTAPSRKPQAPWRERIEGAEKDPLRYERAALRWLVRYLTEIKPTLLSAQLALSALGELRAGDSAHAARMLVELATRA